MKRPLLLLALSLPLVLLGGITGLYGLKTLAVACFVVGALWFLGHAIATARDDDEF